MIASSDFQKVDGQTRCFEALEEEMERGENRQNLRSYEGKCRQPGESPAQNERLGESIWARGSCKEGAGTAVLKLLQARANNIVEDGGWNGHDQSRSGRSQGR